MSYKEGVAVNSFPWEQRHGMHKSPWLFSILAMITGNEEGCKELVVTKGGKSAAAEGFVGQNLQGNVWDEQEASIADGVQLENLFIVEHAALPGV